jgi:hypothetical protein
LKAPNKDFVRKILVDAFMLKESTLSIQNTVKTLCSTLEIDQATAEKVNSFYSSKLLF